MKQIIPLSTQVWEESDVCPHCGRDGIEYHEEWNNEKGTCTSWMECLWCEVKSVVTVTEMDCDENE